eukprot:c16553_g1_i2.p1 GENE.c16553_g1_i2~~c16553_g1_i2.p1  ORF type:complete len:326 (+),score=87.64 c16553_g1_i2:59-1036(+)
MSIAVNQSGEFVRPQSSVRNFIKADGSTPYQPEAGRYHLYISYACPWASSAYLALRLKGLEDAISISVVATKMEKTKDDPNDTHSGWWFKTPEEESGCIPDPILNAKTVREVYERLGAQAERFSVPLLVDKKTNTVVNNESSEIIRMFDQEFQDFAKNKDFFLFPQDLESTIAETNEWVYNTINNGVYKCGFATTQEAYDKAVENLFLSLDKADAALSNQRYLCGDRPTFVDFRLFVTLVRFDAVYHHHFKCNRRYISQYPNLHNFVLDIYQLHPVSETVNMDHIRKHYYSSMRHINPTGIIPIGPELHLDAPHDRNRFSNADQK